MGDDDDPGELSHWKARQPRSKWIFTGVFALWVLASIPYSYLIQKLLRDRWHDPEDVDDELRSDTVITLLCGLTFVAWSLYKLYTIYERSRLYRRFMLELTHAVDDMFTIMTPDGGSNVTLPGQSGQGVETNQIWACAETMIFMLSAGVVLLWQLNTKTRSINACGTLVSSVSTHITLNEATFKRFIETFKTFGKNQKSQSLASIFLAQVQRRICVLEQAHVVRSSTQVQADLKEASRIANDLLVLDEQEFMRWMHVVLNFFMFLYLVSLPIIRWPSIGWLVMIEYPIFVIVVGSIVTFSWFHEDCFANPTMIVTYPLYECLMATAHNCDNKWMAMVPQCRETMFADTMSFYVYKKK